MNPPLTFTVVYFGLLAERRGLSQETLAHCATTPAELYAELDRVHGLGLSIADFRVAVNDQFVAWDHVLADHDAIALLPPMSGG
jgi:molybdopterin synthase sulfur carrier subunit